MQLLAAGHTHREIGQQLFISPKTAGVHVTNILRKLAVRDRVQAAAAAVRLGLVNPPPAADEKPPPAGAANAGRPGHQRPGQVRR